VTARRNALFAGSALALFALVAATVPATMAQDATPVPGATPAQEGTPIALAPPTRPVHIHAGDCVDLGEVVIPLTDLTVPVGNGVGQADEATAAESSFTVVPQTFDSILAADHAINVHLSADEIDTYLACGEIGGVVDLNGQLVVGLRETSNSGYTGIAFLAPNVDGVSTNVSVFIAPVFGAAG
jgi:hypothetical protein